jgi:hypothetical protein
MAHIRVINIYCSQKIIFLHVDVKERTVLSARNQIAFN